MKYSIYLSFCLCLFSCAVNKSTVGLHPYTGDIVGCGNFVVYQLSEDRKEYISIKLTTSDIEFQTSQAFAVGKVDFLTVSRRKFAGDIAPTLCNDLMMQKPEQLLEERATAGLAEFELDEENLRKAKNNQPYRVNITLRDVIFEGTTINYINLQNIYVGWLPG